MSEFQFCSFEATKKAILNENDGAGDSFLVISILFLFVKISHYIRLTIQESRFRDVGNSEN